MQELITHRSAQVAYREGAVQFRRTFRNRVITGQGCVEMKEYAEKLNI